jgi:ABC-type uncharacterized transport system permease subunit
LGTVAVTVGFVTGLMYLLQAHRLKKKVRPGQGLRLPSLEWLQRVNGRTISISVFMLAGGFFTGLVLDRINHAQSRVTLPWSDPVVVSSTFLVLWMLVAWLFNSLYKPAQQGRKVAYLTVASFVFLVIALIAVLADTQHGGRKDGNAEGGRESFLAAWMVTRCEDSSSGKKRLPTPRTPGLRWPGGPA